MRDIKPSAAGRARYLTALAVWAVAAMVPAAAPPKAPDAPPATLQDMSSILGEGSQLQAAPDGEFSIEMGEDNQLARFRAIKDVILLSKDNDLKCDELVYDRAAGKLIATAPLKGLVYITMKGGSDKSSQSVTRATCRHYEFHINEKRHVLKSDPTIYQQDKGKTAAISGDEIEMTQDASGKWRMHVRGRPQIFDPSKPKTELAKAREKTMRMPVLNMDTVQPTPTPAKGSGRPVKIDEGNVEKLQQPKSPRVLKIEEGS